MSTDTDTNTCKRTLARTLCQLLLIVQLRFCVERNTVMHFRRLSPRTLARTNNFVFSLTELSERNKINFTVSAERPECPVCAFSLFSTLMLPVCLYFAVHGLPWLAIKQHIHTQCNLSSTILLRSLQGRTTQKLKNFHTTTNEEFSPKNELESKRPHSKTKHVIKIAVYFDDNNDEQNGIVHSQNPLRSVYLFDGVFI